MNIAILNRFCASEGEPREYLRSPFSIGDYVYASDGCIVLRVANAGAPEVTPADALPKSLPGSVLGMFTDHHGPFVPIPHHLRPRRNRCNFCCGFGAVKECPECEGEGEVELENDFHTYTIECKTCHGDEVVAGHGAKTCRKCGGAGRVYLSDEGIRIGAATIAHRYLELITGLPAVVIQHPDRNDAPVAIRFAGGEGFVMPLRNPPA